MKILSAIAIALSPDIRITDMPPVPCGVAMAAIVLSVVFIIYQALQFVHKRAQIVELLIY